MVQLAIIVLEKSGFCYNPIVRKAQEVHACLAELFHNTVSQSAFLLSVNQHYLIPIQYLC